MKRKVLVGSFSLLLVVGGGYVWPRMHANKYA
jgi:hypothetical protein